MTKRRRGPSAKTLVSLFILASLLIAIAFLGRTTGTPNTIVLRKLLEANHVQVRDGAAPPAQGTYLLLNDLRDPASARPLIDWVQGGGHLVVATAAASGTLQAVGIEQRKLIGGFGTKTLASNCASPLVAGAPQITAEGSDSLMSTPDGQSSWCFGGGTAGVGGAYVIEKAEGAGTVVAVGGSTPLTDAHLDEADNGVFALRLLANNGGPVVFGTAAAPGTRGKSVWQSVPVAGKAIVLQLLIASIIFAFVKGRRHGKPVLEEPVESIPAGELVHASAALYRRARATAYGGQLLRSSARAKISRMTGIAKSSPNLPATAGAATSVPAGEIQSALDGPAPATDEELLALARELDKIISQLEGADR